MSSARIQISPASRDATRGNSRVLDSLFHALGHLIHKWRPVVMIIILLGIFVAPFYAATNAFESGDGCSTVSATPKRDIESTVSKTGPSRSVGFENYPGNPSLVLAKSRCIFEANLERVGMALSAAPSNLESAINDFAATKMGSVSVSSIVLFIFAFLSGVYFWVNRKGSPERYYWFGRKGEDKRKKSSDDDLSMRGRLFVGPIAWLLLGFSLLYSQHALELLNAPRQKLVALSTVGPLSTDNLSDNTYRRAELNPFGSVMYGFDRQSEFKVSASHIDAYLTGKPVSEKEYKDYAALYNQRVTTENKVGSMQNTAKAVERFGTSLNTTSGILSEAVNIQRAGFLAIFVGSYFLLLALIAIRPVRARRYFKRWIFVNAAPLGLLSLSLAAMLGVNWGGLYAVSYITAPERSGVVWGWTLAAYVVQVIGYLIPWALLYSVYRYYRHTSGWMLKSMVASDDKWVEEVGKALVAAREQRVITGKLLLKIPYFRRKMLTSSPAGATP